jgi:serine/threonine protein kinase/Tol biopolymer transport system component
MTQDPRESQLTEIYQKALAQSPSERERFLEEACGGNDALRHDVQSLLALAPLADRFMESPAVAMVAPALSDGSQVSRPADIIGRALGPYTVTSRIDSGAMGDVYRARDTKLGRDVAIKILPPHLTNDPERRTRFAREARVLAALNHPHIGAIYGLEEGSGISGLVLELVEGQTLAAIIERGQVPIRKLLDIAVQIADGMASAHAAGITHRDLKPANIMVAADGRVKILDFGLAKQKAAAAAVDATTPADRTEPGMIVGTVNYMSPEQARGEIVDYRTDQFSFGVVLYEMATGRKPFARAGSVQTMAAIISEDPPPIDTRMPAPLRWVIDRCLAKDPAGRYESSRDLFRELAGVRDHLSEISREVPQAAEIATTERRTWRRWTIPAALALGAAITLAVVAARSGPALPDQSSYRFTPFSFEPGGQGGAVWSPDGKAVAYAARQKTSDPYQLYVRYLDAPAAVQVTQLSTSVFPVAWSPDSRRVFLLKDEQKPALWSVATVGGDPEMFMSLPDVNAYAADPSAILFELERRSGSVAISPDNQSVAVLMTPGLRVGISSPPGAPLKIYGPAPYETKATFNEPRLRFSPDGRQLLLALNAGRGDEEAWLLPYPPDGTTTPKRVLPDLPSFGGTPTFNWLPDSRHVVLSLKASPDASDQLWLADTTTGERHALTSGAGRRLFSASIAPEGTRLVFTEATDNYDVVSVDFATLTPQTLIATDRRDLMPAWAAAEQALAYVTDRGGPTEIWLHRPGVPDRPLVTARDFAAGSTRWLWGPALSPKGDRLVYARIDRSTNSSLWISSVAGGTPIQVTKDAAITVEFPGSWSPDGGWFVYTAVRDGKRSLIKVKTSGQATPVVLKEVRGIVKVPEWSPAGNWISYDNELISPDGKTTKSLGDRGSYHYMFSPDGTLLYGLRSEKDRQVLFSIEIATGAEKVIGPISVDFTPRSFIHPSIRFSLAPDGKSFVYGTGTSKTNLWMLEGFARPKRSLLGLIP